MKDRGNMKTKSLKISKKIVWYQSYCCQLRASLLARGLVLQYKLLIYSMNLWNKRSILTVFISLHTVNQQLELQLIENELDWIYIIGSQKSGHNKEIFIIVKLKWYNTGKSISKEK